MARKVKCCVTGEEGMSDQFVKVNGRFYKDEETYQRDKQERTARRELVDLFCTDFLDYAPGQPFPMMLVKKLERFSFYPNTTVLHTLQKCAEMIHAAIANKNFVSQNQKISYIIAILDSHIADVRRRND